ncbi:MAG: hypothetical protein Q7U82_16810 [Gammaproteobacteria bacterium]|nr:hypothetical protein [Gammaproteobacteria bacterium]
MNTKHLESVIDSMKFLIPMIQDIISDIENDNGYIKFSSQGIALVTRDGLPPWSSFYEDPLKMRGLINRALFEPEELSQLQQAIQTSTPEQVQELKLDLQRKVIDEMRDLEIYPSLESSSPDQVATVLSAIDATEKTQLDIKFHFLLYSTLTHVHHYLALLTYGRNLCDLVADAKSGDDDAFCKVVRIDRTSLFGIAYFQKRLIRAQVEGDPQFLKKLANAVQAKPLGAKYSHKMLMFVFAILDDEGLLYELSRDKLMTICEELGVYGYDFGVEDPESLRSLLNKYRRRTRRQNQI